VREWIDAGAAIYVCGSRHRMAPDVHDALIEILGDTQIDTMTAAGRYRCDVY
jgi:sulfite reductase (NADPH) flavoprotein alpha-component